MNSQGSAGSQNQHQIDGYDGANAGVEAVMTASGSVQNDDQLRAAGKSFDYIQAYDKAVNEAQNSRSIGASEYLAGQSKPTGTTQIEQSKANGFTDANKGHDAAANGTTNDQLTPAQKANKEFMLGFNSYSDSMSGYNTYEQGGNLGSSATQGQKDSFDGAQDGYLAGPNGGSIPDMTGKSPAYIDAYKKAFE